MNFGVLILVMLFLQLPLFCGVFPLSKVWGEPSSQGSMINPFRSLLPEIKTAPATPQLLSKSPSASPEQQTPMRNQKVRNRSTIPPRPPEQSLQRMDIPAQPKTSAHKFQLKEILETSEGRYAFIDDQSVTYFVQKGEWLGKMYVERVEKNSVEIREFNDGKVFVLKLQP